MSEITIFTLWKNICLPKFPLTHFMSKQSSVCEKIVQNRISTTLNQSTLSDLGVETSEGEIFNSRH